MLTAAQVVQKSSESVQEVYDALTAAQVVQKFSTFEVIFPSMLTAAQVVQKCRIITEKDIVDVNCRIGSLEMLANAVDAGMLVNCRIGSLEIVGENRRFIF